MKLIKFYTNWCGPCKVLTNNILSQVDLSGVELVEVDAEKEIDLATKYKIQSVPVLVFEKDGVEVDRINGIVPAETIEAKIKLI